MNESPARRLAGKKVVVTGAGSGIGRATALACAWEGADVALIGRRQEALEAVAREIEAAVRAVVIPADLSSPRAAHTAISDAWLKLGEVDTIVHAAGSNIKARALSVLSVEDWNDLIQTNLSAAFYVTRAAVPRLRGRGGRIIYIASIAVQRPDASGVAYQASKHGLVGLAHGTMQEERGNGIRTTVIFPGFTDTPLVLKRPVPTAPDVLAKALQPEDVASACVFVATLPARASVPELQVVPSEL